MRRVKLLVAVWAVAATSAIALAARPAKVVVWDPVHATVNPQFTLSTDYLDQASTWLKNSGVEVQRLTAPQIADANQFDAQKFDALMIQGDAFPSVDIDAYKHFLDGGGVIVCLAATGPFEIKIAQNAQGIWRCDPESPAYSWQTTAIYKYLGMQFNYQMDMAFSGANHTPTPLLKKYLPDAQPFSKSLSARWFVPTEGKFYPLIRSQQMGAAGTDYTPQLFIVANGKRHAILCESPIFTGQADTKLWPLGEKTTVALANIARDLHDGTLDLSNQLAVVPPAEVKLPGPLESRAAGKGVDPEDEQPVVRWGKFDGSRLDLGPAAPAGQTVQIPAGTPDEKIPGELPAGSALQLVIPTLGADPAYLRIRGAFGVTSGAVLHVKLGDSTIWNETLFRNNSNVVVNLGQKYGGAATEFTRIVFLPPNPSANTLTISNDGKQSLYFDAIQIEHRPKPTRTVEIGLHTGVGLAYNGKSSLTADICKDWSILRCTTRTGWIGKPDDPQQWKKYDDHVKRYLALSDHCQFIFEGTPEWAAVSAERFAAGGKRPQSTPPDLDKFATIAQRIVQTYGDRVHAWEIWNEANTKYFFAGPPEEYAAMFARISSVIRQYQPTARIIVGGMAGVIPGNIDPFPAAMVESGAIKNADLFAMHVYEPVGQWDVPYGIIEGDLLALGSNIEVYPDEQGFTWKPTGDDFMKQGDASPELQKNGYDVGMSRLMADGVTKITDFNAGGTDDDDFGLFDGKGEPRPAYAVFTDYLELAKNGGHRCDVAMTGPDGGSLAGMYAAASTHDDQSVTLVVNPSEVPALHPPPPVNFEFDKEAQRSWTAFFGKAVWANGTVTITPDAGKERCGFFRKTVLSPEQAPNIEVSVPQCGGRWTLELKFGGQDNPMVFDSDKPGVFKANYAAMLKDKSPRAVEISFRIYGDTNHTTLAYVHFPVDAANPAEAVMVPVHLVVPTAGKLAHTVAATCEGQKVPTQLIAHDGWSDLNLSVPGRTVINVSP